jgi:hypothetical protein
VFLEIFSFTQATKFLLWKFENRAAESGLEPGEKKFRAPPAKKEWLKIFTLYQKD